MTGTALVRAATMAGATNGGDSLKKHKFLEQLDLFEATRQGKARQGKQQQ